MPGGIIIIIVIIMILAKVAELVKNKIDKKKEDDNVIYINEDDKKKGINIKLNFKKIGLVVVALIILGGLSTCFFTVEHNEFAFKTTFGRPNSEMLESGLKFKLPYPIQEVRKVSKETFSLAWGFEEESKVGERWGTAESKMITGDENIILADLEVQWKIVDPISYVYNTSNPEEILYNATSSALRSVIGSSLVDEALTDGRTKIINDIREKLIELTSDYNLGISIINVNLQDVDLPNAEVDAAFKKVTDAREERVTKVNEANKYQNEKLNQVKGERDAIISRANGQKIALIESAKGDVASFNAVYEEYKKNPEITRQRLSIQTLQEIYKNAKVMIVDGGDGTVKYVPIDSILKKEAK